MIDIDKINSWIEEQEERLRQVIEPGDFYKTLTITRKLLAAIELYSNLEIDIYAPYRFMLDTARLRKPARTALKECEKIISEPN